MGYIFAVDEAIEKLITSLSEAIGWKYLKSQRCLKKTVGDLVFEIDFYSSKWNSSHERVEINAGFSMWNKSYDKKLNVNSVTATLMYTPEETVHRHRVSPGPGSIASTESSPFRHSAFRLSYHLQSRMTGPNC